MTAPAKVLELIDRFSQEQRAYRSGLYNETQVRNEFIDPLFRALGWDVENEAGAPEAYKDVIQEDRVKIGGATKAPDYSFRIGGEHSLACFSLAPLYEMSSSLGKRRMQLYGLRGRVVPSQQMSPRL